MDLIQKAKNLGCIIKNDEYYLWEIQKWLRDKYVIHIELISFVDGNYSYNICWNEFTDGQLDDTYTYYSTYEEALEKALLEALLLIH